MKKNKISGLFATALLTTVVLTSCNKEEMTPTQKGTEQEESIDNPILKNITYMAGIISNDGYPVAGQTKSNYYRMYSNVSVGQQAPTYYTFGGGVAGAGYPTVMTGCAATKNTKIFAYKDDQGVTYLQSDMGAIVPVLTSGGAALFTYPIEEIEVYPNSQDVYALCKVGSSMQLYRISMNDGIAVLMSYITSPTTTSPNMFNNTLGNGYKSGSITFCPIDPANPNTAYKLVYTTESNVYSALGIVTWHYDIVAGNKYQIRSSENRTYTTAISGIAGAMTGKINTTYGDGKFYFARDNGALYTINLVPATGTAGTVQVVPTAPNSTITNTNDFGYWRNL